MHIHFPRLKIIFINEKMYLISTKIRVIEYNLNELFCIMNTYTWLFGFEF